MIPLKNITHHNWCMKIQRPIKGIKYIIKQTNRKVLIYTVKVRGKKNQHEFCLPDVFQVIPPAAFALPNFNSLFLPSQPDMPTSCSGIRVEDNNLTVCSICSHSSSF